MARAVGRLGAGALTCVLLLVGCGSAPDDAADAALDAGPGAEAVADADPDAETDADPDADADPVTGPDPDPEAEPGKAPAPAAGPHPFERTHPDLDWPFAADIEVVLAHADAMNAAFAAGNEAGFAYLAATSWPDGFTADALLACRLREPTPTWAELDAMDHSYRFEIRGPIPVPGFQYPPTGEYPSASGLRPYLVYFVAERRVGDEVVSLFEDASRVAIRPDGTAVMFPTCFEFLPGEFLAHRVTDGDVGGYTDAEAAGDVRLIVTSSPRAAQLEVCDLLEAGDLDLLAEMILPPDIEAAGLRIPRDVLAAELTELCAALRT